MQECRNAEMQEMQEMQEMHKYEAGGCNLHSCISPFRHSCVPAFRISPSCIPAFLHFAFRLSPSCIAAFRLDAEHPANLLLT
jgi:hypothetical protein